jgi:hypothetical protein
MFAFAAELGRRGMAEKDRPRGLVVTDDIGNYYYLRPEVLAQAQLPEDEVKKLKSGLASASGKEGVRVTSIKELPQILSNRELSPDEMKSVTGGVAASRTMTSTIMCPW